MALDPTKPPFSILESKVQQQNQSNFGRKDGLKEMLEERRGEERAPNSVRLD